MSTSPITLPTTSTTSSIQSSERHIHLDEDAQTNDDNTTTTSTTSAIIASSTYDDNTNNTSINNSSANEQSIRIDEISQKIMRKTKKTSKLLQDKFNAYTNTITNSKYFKDKCKEVFESVDADKSGSVDFKELYAAILMVYLQLAKVVSGLTPPTMDDVKQLVKNVELDGEDGLNIDEFTMLTSILMQNIAGRIVTQLLLSLLIIPLVATFILTVLSVIMPPPHKIWSYIIPRSLPNTVLATILSMVSLPYLLDRIDEYYANVASKTAGHKKVE